MTLLDYVVLVVYFLAMAGIGLWSMLKIKKQEDFFLGGRRFGKILQAFAAFGAGTGSYDPVAVGRTTYTSGLSGIWSVFLWLFCTPFYWIFAVWYRRMRHLTLGDWFVERYQSKAMGLAYALFGIAFYMFYMALGFSAVGKVCAPLLGTNTFDLPWISEPVSVEFVLVPVFAVVIMVYGVLGGLHAAYWTDLIQGFFIILLSVLLIPAGLNALVGAFGDPETMSTLSGFGIMHRLLPGEYFRIFQTPRAGEFPLHYIIAITVLSLVGIVVQPHFIAIGGGSAKTETAARVGLVGGVFMKRFCSIGWALTALLVLALMADNVDMAEDPDRVWGVATQRLLAPFGMGLVGLMLACLVAALMSSADCYMLVLSALIVRNGYVAYVNPRAADRECLLVGRIAGALMLAGAVMVSLYFLNVFEQLKIAWELPIIFAAPFWVGMFWRRATRWAAWLTLAFSTLVFFIVPALLPVVMPSLAEDQGYVATNDIVTTIVSRPVAPADVARRKAEIDLWQKRVRQWEKQQGAPLDEGTAAKRFGPRPKPRRLGESMDDEFITGGKAIYWKKGVEPIGPKLLKATATHKEKDGSVRIHQQYECPLRGQGSFNLDFLIYDALGVPLTKLSDAWLETLRLPTRIVLPFVVMIILSLITPRVDKQGLDRYYVKMKTPVSPDRAGDEAEIEASCRDPSRFDENRLFPFLGLEVQRPRLVDVAGFVISFLICFAIIGFTVWLAKLGS